MLRRSTWSLGNDLPVDDLRVRPAHQADVAGIAALVDRHARAGSLLPRSVDDIRATLGDWLVAEKRGQILGCVSLLPYTSGLVEVRSLAVDGSAHGNGLGRQLMETVIVEASRRKIPTLFALTRVVDFFQRFGFVETDRAMFPEKVWRDCRLCPLINRCDETAVVLSLEARQ
jgi:N-acetylglutamate synthase-like GNAT family acetyltransferase